MIFYPERIMYKILYKLTIIIVLSFSILQSISFAADLKMNLNSSDLIKKGLELYDQKDYTQARDIFQQASVLDTKNVMTPYYVAKCYYNTNNLDNAAFYYKKTLDMKLDFPGAWYNLGLVYFKLSRYDDALNCFENAIKRDKHLAFAYYNMGNIYYSQNKYQAALDNYSKAIKLNSEYPDFYYNLAFVYQKIHQISLAIKFYEKYSDLQPKDNQVKELINTLKNQGKG
jgi:tetratricopeptide (TPR) repeat protein